jgi:hypothetical protein
VRVMTSKRTHVATAVDVGVCTPIDKESVHNSGVTTVHGVTQDLAVIRGGVRAAVSKQRANADDVVPGRNVGERIAISAGHVRVGWAVATCGAGAVPRLSARVTAPGKAGSARPSASEAATTAT